MFQMSRMSVYPIRNMDCMTTSQAIGHHDSTPRPPAGVFLTERDLAARWQVHPGSLANARGRGRALVPFIRIMNRVRYPLAEVERYEAALVDQAAA